MSKREEGSVEDSTKHFVEVKTVVVKDVDLMMAKWKKLELRPVPCLLTALEEICFGLKCFSYYSDEAFTLEQVLEVAHQRAEERFERIDKNV